jgi:ACS family glucarate transporter-like MFS transporter
MLAYRHRLIFVTFSLAWLLYIDRIAMSSAQGPISTAFGLSDTQFGWVMSAFTLGYALSQIPAGMIVDRFGPRLALAAIVAVWSFFTGLTGLAFGLVSLFVIRFVFGMAEAGAWPACARAFYSWLPPGERGFAKSVNMSGSRLGSAFALPTIAMLITALGWQVSFWVLTAVGLGWAAFWFFWFRDTPEEKNGFSAEERSFLAANRGGSNAVEKALPLGALLRLQGIWLMMGQYFASNFTFFFCISWLFPMMRRSYHHDPVTASWYAAIPLLCGAAGAWSGGVVGDALFRRGHGVNARKWPAMFGFALSAIGVVGALWCSTPLAMAIVLGVAIYGSDMTLPTSWAYVIDVSKNHSGAMGGAMNMAGNLGSFVTTLAWPYLLAATGSTMPFFIAAAVLNVLGVLCWGMVKGAARA